MPAPCRRIGNGRRRSSRSGCRRTTPTAIKKEDLPKTYEDLLDPKWKGKLGIEAKDQDWFATVVQSDGRRAARAPKFFRDLVAKNGISVRKGHTLLNNMVVSGEVPLALTVYNYMPEQAKKKGAPIDWFALEPADRARQRRRRRAASAASERGAAVLRVPAGPEGSRP